MTSDGKVGTLRYHYSICNFQFAIFIFQFSIFNSPFCLWLNFQFPLLTLTSDSIPLLLNPERLSANHDDSGAAACT